MQWVYCLTFKEGVAALACSNLVREASRIEVEQSMGLVEAHIHDQIWAKK